ncbi:MAG: hypothetical protein Q8Q08_06265 [Candidatus Omnitrophota bacterium]|nr:hypothetical protein [Candidatus Omnitrophota bacterium]MDZ4241692.1 hypothetical protein [Candidatus Omnitrophota bacterium]
MEKRTPKAFLFLMVMVAIVGGIPASAAIIRTEMTSVRTGGTVTVNLLGVDYQLKVARVSGTDQVDVEYPDLLTGQGAGDPGACKPSRKKTYMMTAVIGSCLATNTCDGSQRVCFQSIAADGENVDLLLEYFDQ